MLIKSFFGSTMNAAMQNATKEFGEDALILNSRETPLEMRTQGRFEVVATVATLPAQKPHPATTKAPNPFDGLQSIEVQPALGGVSKAISPSAYQEIHFFAGLPGSGKTTCALKAAIVQGVWKGRRVGLLHFDTQRIARQQSVSWYCKAAGIPLWNGREEMTDSEWESFDLIVVDLSGTENHASVRGLLPEFVADSRRQIYGHLVAPAWAGPAYFNACDLSIRQLEIRFLLPSFLDLGLLNEDAASAAAKSDLGVRWLSAGAKVPNGFFDSGDNELAMLAELLNPTSPTIEATTNSGQQIARILAGNRIPRRGNFRAMAATAEQVA